MLIHTTIYNRTERIQFKTETNDELKIFNSPAVEKPWSWVGSRLQYRKISFFYQSQLYFTVITKSGSAHCENNLVSIILNFLPVLVDFVNLESKQTNFDTENSHCNIKNPLKTLNLKMNFFIFI